MRVIGLSDIRAAVYKAIEEKGRHYVYTDEHPEACVYFNEDGSPSCGIGFALATLELKEPAQDGIADYLRAHRSQSSEPSASALFALLNLNDDPHVMFTAAAKHWADMFQNLQDCGRAWGEAASAADARYGTTEYIGINIGTSAHHAFAETFGGMHSIDEHSPSL
jgi:hypothetical protein